VLAKTSKSIFSRVLDRLSVRTKILAALGVVLAVAVSVGMLGIVKLATVRNEADEIYARNLKPVQALADARYALALDRMHVTDVLAQTSTAEAQKAVEAAKTQDAAVDAAMSAYRAIRADGAQSRLLSEFAQDWTAWKSVRDSQLFPAGLRDDDKTFDRVQASTADRLDAEMVSDLDQLSASEVTAAGEADRHADRTYKDARNAVLILLALGCVLALAFGLSLTSRILGALAQVRRALNAMARKDLRVRARVTSRDELGAMSNDVNVSIEALRTTVAALAESSGALSTASEELSTTSTQIASAAEETSAQAGVVSSAAEEVSVTITSLSASAEEMTQSIQEISTNATQAAGIAQEAVVAADSTSRTLADLGESSVQIGDVVKTITSIAEQTNLLALNATIEAARAGEAGRGFAVVAGEVKDLAQETARATEDISARVAAIQSDSEAAAGAIGRINEVVAQISAYQTTIASAVEEQTATTGEMSRSVSEASVATSEISSNVGSVAQAAESTSAGAQQTRAAASELARLAVDLTGMVEEFAL
jgi:methyl-accepting chemotaxis protein